MELDSALARLRGLADATIALLPSLLIGLIIFGLFLLAARGVRAAVGRAPGLRGRSPGLALVLGRIGGGLTILIGIFVGAAIAFPSLSAADLFGLLGIGGVAIGFAFRDILQNLLAGILILLTQPFRLGDQIKVGEFEGTVEDIKVRATTIRTYDNRRAVIPNSDLFAGKVLVNTAYERRRLTIRFSIGNGDDIADAKRVILGVARGAEGVLPDPAPVVRVAELGDFAVQLGLFVWIDPPQRVEMLDVIDRVLERGKAALTEAGIDLPFPTQQVLLHDQTEATDGDRTRQREGWPARSRGTNPRPRRSALDGQDAPERAPAGAPPARTRAG